MLYSASSLSIASGNHSSAALALISASVFGISL